jgi:hypothetical protein
MAVPVIPVARVRLQEHGRRTHAVSRDAVAMGTVLAEQASLCAGFVTAHRAGGHRDFLEVQPRFRKDVGLVRRAEHRFEDFGDLEPLLLRDLVLGQLHHIGAEFRREIAAAGEPKGRQEAKDRGNCSSDTRHLHS